jgi:phage repressor protein C with HTH and peptisase S24 domain
MAVKERLIIYLARKKISKSDFGKSIGVSNAYVTSIRKSIDKDKIKSIASNYPDLNIDWLLYGDGEMLVQNEQKDDIAEKIIYIPLLPISAQGGSLNDFIVSVKETDCEKIVSPIKGADFAVTVSGDSMSPEYPSGAQVLVKKINEKAFIDWGKTYVLDTCNGTVIKILAPSEKEGCVKCISINRDEKYAPFDIALNDINGIYRVMLCMAIK